MRSFSKLVLLAILVLSLSILAQPQPGICASMVEYGDLIGCGEIATLTGFKTARIGLRIKEANATGKLYIGKLAVQWEGSQIIVDCTVSVNEATGEIYITAAGNAHAFVFFDGISTMYLQVPGQGISGIFTFPCPE